MKTFKLIPLFLLLCLAAHAEPVTSAAPPAYVPNTDAAGEAAALAQDNLNIEAAHERAQAQKLADELVKAMTLWQHVEALLPTTPGDALTAGLTGLGGYAKLFAFVFLLRKSLPHQWQAGKLGLLLAHLTKVFPPPTTETPPASPAQPKV